jgi:proteasome accessory factor C
VPKLAAETAQHAPVDGAERTAGPVVPERFAVLQSLLSYLLAECGEGRDAEVSAREIVERFHIPEEQLEEHLSLLNLVNFGGGCYAVYAELDEDAGVVRVDKELYGDTFRWAPRLTPLEARAIRLALDFVGPTIAAEAHSPLDRVRARLEQTFGEFDLAPEPHGSAPEERLIATLTEGINQRRLVEVEYQKEGDEEPSTRVVEPYKLERQLPHWHVHTWDRTKGGERSFRLDRMKGATLTQESFEPRPDFEPHRLTDARLARVWYSKAVARYQVERGARPLKDRSAVAEMPVGSEDWLIREVFSFRGEAVVLEPADMRKKIAAHARELARELGVQRLRA